MVSVDVKHHIFYCPDHPSFFPCFREAYIKFRFGISPILVHRLRFKNDVIPRDLLCPVWKDEIEDESHVLFSCKAYEDFRKDGLTDHARQL